MLDAQGRPQWDRLHKRHAQRSPERIQRAAVSDPAAIFAFDLLWLNGADFRPRPLLERKAALHRTLPANRRVRYARHLNDDCLRLWEMAVRLELEGIVAKDAARSTKPAARRAGRRSRRRSAPSGNGSGVTR